MSWLKVPTFRVNVIHASSGKRIVATSCWSSTEENCGPYIGRSEVFWPITATESQTTWHRPIRLTRFFLRITSAFTWKSSVTVNMEAVDSSEPSDHLTSHYTANFYKLGEIKSQQFKNTFYFTFARMGKTGNSCMFWTSSINSVGIRIILLGWDSGTSGTGRGGTDARNIQILTLFATCECLIKFSVSTSTAALCLHWMV